METFLKGIGMLVLSFVIIFVASFITAFFVKISWNYIMPFLFKLPEVGYWQAFVISFLSGLLFRGNTTVKSKD